MIFKSLSFAFAIAIILYQVYVITSPSVSLLNSSDSEIVEGNISLNNGELSFGQLQDGEDKALSYSLLSGSGEYTYYFKLSNEAILTGTCGDFKNFEVSKRVIFLVSNKKVIYTNSNGEPHVCRSTQV
tara:strand:- start:120 stop:503 length:384 start_codon:yes stop_codon:yes gene_type:complete